MWARSRSRTLKLLSGRSLAYWLGNVPTGGPDEIVIGKKTRHMLVVTRSKTRVPMCPKEIAVALERAAIRAEALREVIGQTIDLMQRAEAIRKYYRAQKTVDHLKIQLSPYQTKELAS